MSDLSSASARPSLALHERSLRRAVDHMKRHYAEPLRRSALARIAGFSNVYFSELFKQEHGISCERYIQKLRIDRAKVLLVGTDLKLERVAELSGFRTRIYLGHVFRRTVGMTPLEWRRKSRGKKAD
jgi:iron complex transport system substrate-binding protein